MDLAESAKSDLARQRFAQQRRKARRHGQCLFLACLCAGICADFCGMIAQSEPDHRASKTPSSLYTQPTEIITATPLSVFSQRAEFFPSFELPQDQLKPEAEPLADTMGRQPGITARENGSPTVSIRGSVQADRVLQMYDGIPLNLADGIGAITLFIPTEAIGSIRVLKSPASVFYGSSAVRGVIDYHTRLFDEPAMRVTAADDSGYFGPRSAMLAMPFTFHPVSTKSSASKNVQVTGYYERAPGRTAYSALNGFPSGRLNHNSSESARASFSGTMQFGNVKISPNLVFVHDLGENPGPLDAPAVTSFEHVGALASLSATERLSDKLDLTARLSHVQMHGQFDKQTASASDSVTSKSSLNIDLNYVASERLLAKTFADLGYDSLRASYGDGQNFYDNDIELGQSYEFTLRDGKFLIPAFRYRSDLGRWTDSLTFLNTSDQLRSWIMYTEGDRRPSLSDRFSHVSYFLGNPGLKPERSVSIEAGFSSSTDTRVDGFSYGASLYTIRDTNFIDTVAVAPSVISKVNSGEGRTYGAEISASYNYRIWTASVGYSYMEARNESTHEPLRLSPNHQLVVTVSQQLGPLVMELQETDWSSYRDREYSSNTMKVIAGWHKFDFNLRTLAFTSWEIKAGILNLFDQPRELTWGYPESQRRFYLSVLRYL